MKPVITILLLLFSFQQAQAYRMLWGRTVNLTQPVYEDLYIAGGTVTLSAPVYGDLIIAGGTVYINDSVKNDLLVAGGKVTINGYVADDIRCAGGELYINKNIGGDLVLTGGKVEIKRQVVIAGGLVASGGEIMMAGTVSGDIRSTAGNFIFSGTAQKNFDYRGRQLVLNGDVWGNAIIAANQITIGENAAFNNGVRYWSKKGELDFKSSIKNGAAVFDPALKLKTDNWYFLGHSTLLGLSWYLITVFLFLLLIEFLFGKTFKIAGNQLTKSVIASLGWGLLFIVGIPVLVVLLLLTIIGIPFGLILMACYIGFLILTTIIVSLVLANWVNYRFQHQWKFWKLIFAAFGFFVLLKIITFTPFFGWLIMFIIACIAIGALLRNIHWHRNREMVGAG